MNLYSKYSKHPSVIALRSMSTHSVLLEEPDWPPSLTGGLSNIGTGKLACNVINNTVNTTVQQCTQFYDNNLLSNCKQFKQTIIIHLVLP